MRTAGNKGGCLSKRNRRHDAHAVVRNQLPVDVPLVSKTRVPDERRALRDGHADAVSVIERRRKVEERVEVLLARTVDAHHRGTDILLVKVYFRLGYLRYPLEKRVSQPA